MLQVRTEFRKGVLFVRLVGRMNHGRDLEEIFDLIETMGIQCIVFNVSFLNDVSLESVDHIMNDLNTVIKKKKLLIICDETKRRNRLFKNIIPKISNEMEVFSLLKERTT